MDRPDTFNAIVAGLRAAGWQLHRSSYRGGVLASTEICHGGSSPDKLSIWPREDGGYQAKCWTTGCEGRELYDAIRRAAGVEDRHFPPFPAPGGSGSAQSRKTARITPQGPQRAFLPPPPAINARKSCGKLQGRSPPTPSIPPAAG